MKITSIEFFRLDMPLAFPYTIAYETVSHATNVVIKIQTDAGLVGWGCAAPDKEVTGESPEQVIENIKTVIEPVLLGENPFRISRFNSLFREKLPNDASSRAMADIALYDLLARKAGLPLYQLLGGFRSQIPTSITLGILPLYETMEQASFFFKKGFSIMKLKGGLSIEEDIEKVHALREKFGSKLTLRFDANQGYSVSESVDFIQSTQKANIEIFEQPTSQNKESRLGEVIQKINVPVMADESIKNLKDAFRLASNEFMDMANIKLMKVGGIMESQQINSVAESAGMDVMVGCLDECTLGISAGLHFALSRKNIAYADLDGHLDLLEDPFSGLFSLKNGILYPTEVSGLGDIKL